MKCFFLFIGLILSQTLVAQNVNKPKVILGGSVPDEKLRVTIQNNLSEVLGIVSSYTRDKKPFVYPPAFGSSPERRGGMQQLKELADVTDLRYDERVLESDLVNLIDGSFEVRRIYVTVRDSIYRKEQELVTLFDKTGYLIGARYAMAEHQYESIINNAEDLEDEYRRKQLINYLEQFRTAYNRKDADFIEQQFSDNALIITGTRIDVARDVKAPHMKAEHTNPQEYKLTRQSKTQYIASLRNKVFKRNAFIDVQFEDIKVYKHPDYPAVYGINLLQKWTTSWYSDVGYLFLMIDYTDEMRPVIYVRAWQPESMIKAGNKIIDIDAFEIIK
jgi:hypothetical protein